MPDELYNNYRHGSAKEGCCQNSSSNIENRQKKTTRKNTERRLEKCRGKEMTVREREIAREVALKDNGREGG